MTGEGASIVMKKEGPSIVITGQGTSIIMTGEGKSIVMTENGTSIVMTEDGTSTVMTREGASIVMTEVNIIRRESINDPNSQHNVGKYNTWQVDSIFLRGRRDRDRMAVGFTT